MKTCGYCNFAEVPDEVIICPNCKKAYVSSEQRKKGNKIFGIGCATLIAIMIIFLIISSEYESCSKSNTPNAPVSTEIVHNSSWDGSVSQVKAYVKDHLGDPGSYESIDWSPVNKTDGQTASGIDYQYMVRHKYRAKNAFGAYVQESKIFYLDRYGSVVAVGGNR